MNVKNPKKFGESNPASYDGLFDWDFLKPAFAPTKIEPTDIDAVIERHGYFLILETKTPGTLIPDGQRIMFEELLKLGRGRIFVLIFYGKTFETIKVMETW